MVVKVAPNVSVAVEPGDVAGPTRLTARASDLAAPKRPWFEAVGSVMDIEVSAPLAAPLTLSFNPPKRPSPDHVPMLWRHDAELGWYPIGISFEDAAAESERTFFSPFSWGWARRQAAADAVAGVTRELLGDRSALLNCSGAPSWMELSEPAQDVVHACATTNVDTATGTTRGEVQMRNNRGYIVEVVPPAGTAYVWVEGQPDAVRGIVRKVTGRDSVLLSPSQLMTVGFDQPPETGIVSSIRTGLSASAVASTLLAELSGDSDSLVGVYAVLADCSPLAVPLDLSPPPVTVKDFVQKALTCIGDLVGNSQRMQGLAFGAVAAQAGVDVRAVAVDKTLARKADKLAGALKHLGAIAKGGKAVSVGSKLIDVSADFYTRAEVGDIDSMSPLVSLRPQRRRALDLRTVDWQNVAIPGELCGGSGMIQLRNGEATTPSTRWPQFPTVQVSVFPKNTVYGDLDGDGREEAGLQVGCNRGRGTSSGQLAFGWVIYNGASGQPRVIGTVTPQQPETPEVQAPLINPIEITKGVITTQEFWYGPKDPLCCASGRATTRWTYTGGQLVAGRPTVTTAPTTASPSTTSTSAPAGASTGCAIAGATGRYVATVAVGRTRCETVNAVWAAYESAGGPGKVGQGLLRDWGCLPPRTGPPGVIASCVSDSDGAAFDVLRA